MKQKVFIVGGGTSLEGFDFKTIRNVDCMAVNKSWFDIPFAKYWISMDYTIKNKIDINLITSSKFFVVSLVDNEIIEKEGKFINTTNNKIYELKDFDVIIKSKGQLGFGTSWKHFKNGANSGYCAIQLAILLGYTEIYLLGIDLTTKDKENTHYHSGYPQNRKKFEDKLIRDYERFKIGLTSLPEGIKVYSCSKISKLNDVIPYKELGI